MSLFQRMKNVIAASVYVIFAVLILTHTDIGHFLIIMALGFGFLFDGLKYIVYYFTMARHMVGGKAILYRGVIIVDFAFFTLTLSDIKHTYIMIYIVGLCLFFGFIDIMRALEMKKLDSPWKFKFVEGLIYVAIAATGVVFIENVEIGSYIYASGLIYSALMKIISAFRRTAIVYIP